MTCRDFITFLSAYLEDELAPAERARFETHIELCPSCVAYLETYRQTVDLAKDALDDSDGPVPDDVPEALVSAILAARRREP